MNATAFTHLIGLRLLIARRAADMLVVHFGEIARSPRALPAGHKGEAWRFFAPGGAADHLVFPDSAHNEVLL